MHHLSKETQADHGHRYVFDPDDEPLLTVQPGEEIVIETEDAYHGQVAEIGERDRSKEPRSNPLSGPIAVRGATPGDSLAVHIADIEPLHDYASTYVPSWWWYLGPIGSRRAMDEFLQVDVPAEGLVLPIRDGEVELDSTSIPYEPMIGTIGTAPASNPAPNGPAGQHGGNMDLPILEPGCTIYLPVYTEGALLYVGDAHAAQGDAELTGVGAEMPASITLKVDLIRDHEIPWPRVQTDEILYAVAAKTPFSTYEDAIRTAYILLCDWMSSEYNLGKWEALRLCGLAGHLVTGNFNCVAAGIERELLR